MFKIFYFEKVFNDLDFPFYNNNPGISVIGWIVLFMSILIGALVFIFFFDYSEFLANLIYFIMMFVPLLYYARWNYRIILHKPSRDELKLAILMFVSYILYALIVSSFLDVVGFSVAGSGMDEMPSFETFISLIFSIMNEELIKFIPLMFLMRFFYKYSENREISYILSSILILIGFGLLHYGDGLTLYSVLIFQGLGSIFEIYGYYKTKNLLVPYLSHLFTDAFIFALMFINF